MDMEADGWFRMDFTRYVELNGSFRSLFKFSGVGLPQSLRSFKGIRHESESLNDYCAVIVIRNVPIIILWGLVYLADVRIGSAHQIHSLWFWGCNLSKGLNPQPHLAAYRFFDNGQPVKGKKTEKRARNCLSPCRKYRKNLWSWMLSPPQKSHPTCCGEPPS